MNFSQSHKLIFIIIIITIKKSKNKRLKLVKMLIYKVYKMFYRNNKLYNLKLFLKSFLEKSN